MHAIEKISLDPQRKIFCLIPQREISVVLTNEKLAWFKK
jgi:hypothetical protein